MKAEKTKEISVFLASPGDLAPERKVFKEKIDALNAGFADGAGVKYIPLGWEDVLATTGRRTQAVINKEVQRCDLFILALHRRWGQEAPDSDYSSYTEEEFQLAFDRWKKTKAPEVLVFFKTVDSASVADPGPELKKVLAFRKKLEQEKVTLIRNFSSDADFANEVDRHLRAFARGEWQQLDAGTAPVEFPKKSISALQKGSRRNPSSITRGKTQSSIQKHAGASPKKLEIAAKADLTLVKAQDTELTLARAAVDAALAGRIQDATILFAKATENTTDLTILAVAAEFFRQIGDVENATTLVKRQASIARDRMIAAQHYLALVPQGYSDSIQEQFLSQFLAAFPPDIADEIQSIHKEVFGGGKYMEFVMKLMVKHYSTAEIVQLARFLSTPEGQSSLKKYPLMMKDAMEYGASEFQRVLTKRHPELTGNPAN
jgi:hypothetical protein